MRERVRRSVDGRTVRGARGRPRAAAAVALAALLVGPLAGCGIEPSDVIDAGEPATGLKSDGQAPADVQLFFLASTGLRSAARSADRPATPQRAVDLLLTGPNAAERQRGLTTALPDLRGRVTVTSREGRLTVTMPADPEKLDQPALSQLVCTAANGQVPGDRPPEDVPVTVRGKDVEVGPLVCGGNNAYPYITPRSAPPSAAPTAAPDGTPSAAPRS
ncbi:hypothetical protein [Streptomyces purpurogeneiscleroticus]|uniref:hypothetical protein n=1 Tax=Streptomyces purpurogeneiscleroticus TaxID=68259 RepID=UPI001CBE4B6E|nr:hypothetical protein [Streptomyces purpurogeneiscleroticus]MBZ4014877.1 hypothetical protein [Streptomyces purpurogeneiscleroticus]